MEKVLEAEQELKWAQLYARHNIEKLTQKLQEIKDNHHHELLYGIKPKSKSL